MPILIDSHVHIHPDFPVDRFLDAAWDNFTRIADRNEMSGNLSYVLALTEGNGIDIFTSLKQQSRLPGDGAPGLAVSTVYEFFQTAEPDSLIARRGERTIVLVAGRQIIRKENIELLSLLCSFKIEDKTLSLADLAKTVVDKGGLPVLPWGVGKWWGARGRVVAALLHSAIDFPLFLGDNGNRPTFWPEPALLRQSRDMQIPVLSGSDPLPLASHLMRSGSYGVLLPDGELFKDYPVASLHKMLISGKEITGFGSRAGSLQFIIDQLRVNLRKRFARRPGQ
jgi:hypothetical protein